jgi:hypothetical protein
MQPDAPSLGGEGQRQGASDALGGTGDQDCGVSRHARLVSRFAPQRHGSEDRKGKLTID